MARTRKTNKLGASAGLSTTACLTAAAALLAAGCGSGHEPTASTAATSAPSTPTASAPARTSPSPTAATTATPGPAPAATATSAPAPAATGTASASQAGGASNVRLPATFTIRAGDALTPSTVSAPAFVAVSLTVISADRRTHRVTIATSPQRRLTVPSEGRATVLLPGLRAGRYAIDVDKGTGRGALIVGGEPGP